MCWRRPERRGRHQRPLPAHAAAIQAIQQAPDPSAVVSAYANGIALDRYDAKLYEAYVARMVDLGLQEMAYHQARMLTSLQFSNGLAWGVVAYVAARRGQMPEAVSAINLAGQFAPENQFVAHTAGELVAWYDLKADKTALSEHAKHGLAKVRLYWPNKSLSPALTRPPARHTRPKPNRNSSQPSLRLAKPHHPRLRQGNMRPRSRFPDAPLVPTAPVAPLAPQAASESDLVAPLGYAAPAPAPDYYPELCGSVL